MISVLDEAISLSVLCLSKGSVCSSGTLSARELAIGVSIEYFAQGKGSPRERGVN